MVISAGEPGADIATNLINQILVEELIPSGWEFCKVGNCYKEKIYSRQRKLPRTEINRSGSEIT